IYCEDIDGANLFWMAEDGRWYIQGDKTRFTDGDDDEGYESSFRTKYFDFGEPGSWKRMVRASLDFHNSHGEGTLTWEYEETDTESITLDQSLTSSNPNASRSLAPVKPA